MKKYSIFFIALTISIISGCIKEIDGTGDNILLMNLDEFEASDVFSPQGGSFMLKFSSSGEWTAEITGDGNTDWLTLDKVSGYNGDTDLLVSTGINDSKKERSAILSLKTGDISKDILITQSSSTVIEKLSISRFSISSDAQEICTELRTGYGEPDVQLSDGWISLVSIEKISQINYKITMAVSANSEKNDRSGSVKIVSGNNSVYNVSVVQEANKLDLLEHNLVLGCSGGNFNIYVKSNVDISVEDIPDWIEFIRIYDSPVKIVSLRASRNMSAQTRNTTLNISAEGMETMPFNITQEADINEAWNGISYARHNLIFKFTGTWCGFCPDMSASLDDITDRNPDRFSIISIYNNSENEVNYISNTLQNYYAVNMFPTGIMDGRAVFFNMNTENMNSLLMDLASEADEIFPSNCNADVNSVIENGKLEIGLTAYCYRPGNYKIAIAIVEDNVKAFQNGTDDGKNYIHNHVLRKFVTDELGDEFIIENSSSKVFEYEIPMPGNILDPANCRIIAFFYAETPYMYSFVDGTDTTGNGYYIDNVIEAGIGESTRVF